MRTRSIVSAAVALLLASALLYLSENAPSAQGQTRAIPRSADGKPNLQGVWQVVNSANWDLEPHSAEDGIPGGLGVVEGGTIPYLATRFSIIDEMNVIPGAEERGTVADTLRGLYWDTALSWRPPVLRMLRSVVGMGQVLFGSDYPYLRRDLAVACRQEVETSAELDSEESRAVLAGNAVKLFPRLAARTPIEKESVQNQRTRSK